jgi:hypothetical protein
VRKILIKALIVIALIVAMSILWISGGRQLSLFIDKSKTIETASTPIRSLVYEGSGTRGTLNINDLVLNLDSADSQAEAVHIGTSKDGQLALSFGGKLFVFGPPRSETESLATAPPDGDNASITTLHSALSWPTPLDVNFMTGQSPSWRRHLYYRLDWKKPSGAKLEMLWRFEQRFYSDNGWLGGSMTYERDTGLIRVDIQN